MNYDFERTRVGKRIRPVRGSVSDLAWTNLTVIWTLNDPPEERFSRIDPISPYFEVELSSDMSRLHRAGCGGAVPVAMASFSGATAKNTKMWGLWLVGLVA